MLPQDVLASKRRERNQVMASLPGSRKEKG
jgi:hypothetical protein